MRRSSPWPPWPRSPRSPARRLDAGWDCSSWDRCWLWLPSDRPWPPRRRPPRRRGRLPPWSVACSPERSGALPSGWRGRRRRVLRSSSRVWRRAELSPWPRRWPARPPWRRGRLGFCACWLAAGAGWSLVKRLRRNAAMAPNKPGPASAGAFAAWCAGVVSWRGGGGAGGATVTAACWGGLGGRLSRSGSASVTVVSISS